MSYQVCSSFSVKGESGMKISRAAVANCRTKFVGKQLQSNFRALSLQSNKYALRSGQSIVCSAVKEKAGSKDATNPWWSRDLQPNMIEVNSAQELVDVLACFNSRLVIVDFYATWCGACRALHPKLTKLCKENPDIILVKVNWEKNREIAKPLGVKVLPYFQFYYGPQGKIAQFSASVSKIQRLKNAIAEHTTPRCLLSPIVEEPVLSEFPDVRPQMNALNISGNVVTFDDKISGLNSESSELAFA
eukprot:TRINITY_DN17797_c0_g2_i2.p1 TRINITY_DN17797_c0_g2~~TRINITY_DN17797_c0_g2_i2.p1  ORF type:complete len:246 (+),score=33.63 TRINITY_DN17797_c0_g2_i2:222-959(+)